MARSDIAGLFRVNRSVTTLDAETRPMRLPAVSPFPRLGQKIGPVAARRGATLIGGLDGSLPEITTDVLDVATGYAVENVKRDRIESRPSYWGQLVGRVLGSSHRAARP